MLETWLSKERLLLNSTPRFLTHDEELTEQPSSVRQCSRLLHVEVLYPVINTPFFQNLAVRNYKSSSFFISTMHSVNFANWCFIGSRSIELSDTMSPDDISQG